MGTKTYNNYQDLITFSRASSGYALRPVTYGSELVTNGTFDSDVTSWPVSSGTFVTDNSDPYEGDNSALLTASAGAGRAVQNLTTEVGKLYHLSCFVKYNSGDSGSVEIFEVVENNSKTLVTSSDTDWRQLSYNFVATSTTSQIRIRERGVNDNASFFIDNVSVKEVTFDEVGGRLTLFEHPNNIPRIEYALNDSKERFEGIDDQILKAVVGTEPQATEFDVLVNGQKIGDITNNGDVSAFDASQYLSWLTGTLTNQTYIDYIEDVLNPYIEANLDKYILPYPEGVDRRGLLIEGAKTNLIANSDFDAGVSQSAVTITPRASESPDGLQNATSLNITSSGAFAYFTVSVTAGTEYTWSWFAKLGTATAHVYAVYDVTNAAFVSRDQYTLTNGENYGRGWYRHSETFTAPSGCTEVRVYAVRATDDNGGVAGAQGTTFVWGGQVEAAGFASSIIRTTGSSATRSADVPTINTSEFGFNAKNFTVLCEWDTIIPAPVQWDSFNRIVGISDAGGTENVSLIGSQGNASVYGVVYADGAHQLSYFAFQTDGNPEKTAFRVGTDTFLIANDGTLLTEDTSVNMPTLLDRMGIGINGGNLTQHLNGYLKSIKYYPRRLTNAQLQDITS